jgi:hypothetical protein
MGDGVSLETGGGTGVCVTVDMAAGAGGTGEAVNGAQANVNTIRGTINRRIFGDIFPIIA